MAVATVKVLKMKYAVAAPSSGFAISIVLMSPALPPRTWYSAPAACTVMIRHAILNSVRWIGLRSLMRKVHWLKALTAATIIVSFGPSRSSEAKSTAYDTDIVEDRRA